RLQAIERCNAVLQQRQLNRHVQRDQVAARRQDLAELDEDRPEFLQGHAQARATRQRRDFAGRAWHEWPRQLQPTPGRRVVQQVLQAVARQHAADAPGAQQGLHRAAPLPCPGMLRCARAIFAAIRSTSSRKASTSSWNASSSARATTSRLSSVTYSAAV